MRADLALYLFTLLTAVTSLGIEPRSHVVRIASNAQSDEHDLYKRKGGGRGGSSGGGGKTSGGKVSGSGGSSSGGSSGNRGSSGSSRPANAQPGSTAGGSSFAGSGPQPRFGQGGRFYGGGARTPYKAGGSRGGLAAPLLLGGAALAFWPGLWLGSAYAYNYPHHYQYHNETTDEDESKPVICGCAEDSVCSCEENNSTLKELVGDGSYDGLNKSVIDVAKVNGTTYILVNGTLPPGTTLKDEANNQDQANDDDSAAMRVMVETLGLWPAVAAVAAAVYLV